MASAPNSLVATLIASPSEQALTDEIVNQAARSLGQETEQAILARGIAADLIVPGATDARSIEAFLRKTLHDHPIDVVVQPLATRRKRLCASAWRC
jgi:phosphoserine phosphatase